MCGIAGIVWSDVGRTQDGNKVQQALGAIRHRGPDGDGTLIVPGFAGGMRRLAIIDLSGGTQPIYNEEGDIAVLFNGEIYNYRELRQMLQHRGHRFRTESDTEVLVHMYEEFGSAFVRDLDGMFAFAIWDARARTCMLARDRFGIKPLHFVRTAEGLAFASEIKALVAAGWVSPQINTNALGAYMRFGWVPEGLSMWKGVERLPPAHWMQIVDGQPREPVRYHRHRIGGGLLRSADVADEEVVSLLRAAVERQLVADVPVGLFLSGGLDSSLLAAAAHQLGRSLPCHTIRFRSKDQTRDPSDDAPHAIALAERLGFDIHVHEIEPSMVKLLPQLMRSMDEPAGDPAMINAYLIAEAARPVSKVLLSGMGADELVGGYRRHLAADVARPIYRLPAAARRAIVRAARGGARLLAIPGISGQPTLRRVQKALNGIPAEASEVPESFATWTPDDLVSGLGVRPALPIWESVSRALEPGLGSDPLEACLAFDLVQYLPSHNLHYTDKATMAASVEVRVPFLDNALSAYLLALAPQEKVKRLATKVALRRAARGLLPESILRRRKAGFGAPIRSWLAGELRPLVQELLSESSVRARGIFDPRGVATILERFDRDAQDLTYPVWFLLSFEIWCQQVIGGSRSTAPM